MAVADFRVACGFASHPKIRKLERRLGAPAVLALVRLWAWTAANRPTGQLLSMDADDIEIAADWEGGQQGELVSTLVDLRLLDRDNLKGQYNIHDWADHQGWVAGSEERSRQARAAAQARWQKNAAGKNEQCGQHADSNADSIDEQCPPPTITLPTITSHNSTTTPLPPAAPEQEPAAGSGGENAYNFKELARQLVALEIKNGRKIHNLAAYQAKVAARLIQQGGPNREERASLGLVDKAVAAEIKKRITERENRDFHVFRRLAEQEQQEYPYPPISYIR